MVPVVVTGSYVARGSRSACRARHAGAEMLTSVARAVVSRFAEVTCIEIDLLVATQLDATVVDTACQQRNDIHALGFTARSAVVIVPDVSPGPR